MSVQHSPPASIGLENSFRDDSGSRRSFSSSSFTSVQNAVSPCGYAAGNVMNASRVNALRRSVNEHVNAVSRLLMTSKDSAEKRSQIGSSIRSCKEAFFELSAVYLCLLEEKRSDRLSSESIKNIITQTISQFGVETCREESPSTRSYAAVAGSSIPSVTIARGQSIPVKKSTNFVVMPKKNIQDKFASSKVTKETFQKIIKPGDFNLKVNRIRSTRNNGVRFEALSGDIDKIKKLKELESAGLEIEQVTKLKPRLIVHDVDAGMSKDDIRDELIALNLDKQVDTDVKVIYIFPPKKNRSFVSCVVEVSPTIRAKLLRDSHIHINYSACRLEDYVRVLQCFRCLAFGHLSRDCSAASLCGHCAEGHEMKNCPKKNELAICGNCKRWSHEEQSHSALDGRKCPILKKRIQDKISTINYGW